MASGYSLKNKPRNQVCTTVKEEVNNERSILFIHFFGELTKQVQIRIDAASELCVSGYSTKIFTSDSSTGDTPTVGLNFEELIGSYNLSVAAATLDSKGKEPIMEPRDWKRSSRRY